MAAEQRQQAERPSVEARGSLTLLVERQLHVEGDAVGQRTQVLHERVELPHQQDAGLPGVPARQRHLLADKDQVLELSEMSRETVSRLRDLHPSRGLTSQSPCEPPGECTGW